MLKLELSNVKIFVIVIVIELSKVLFMLYPGCSLENNSSLTRRVNALIFIIAGRQGVGNFIPNMTLCSITCSDLLPVKIECSSKS